jgi:hypothetical protein
MSRSRAPHLATGRSNERPPEPVEYRPPGGFIAVREDALELLVEAAHRDRFHSRSAASRCFGRPVSFLVSGATTGHPTACRHEHHKLFRVELPTLDRWRSHRLLAGVLSAAESADALGVDTRLS